MDFAAAVRVEPQSGGTFASVIDPSWTQGRTAFGGLVAAQCVAAVLTATDAAEAAVRSIDVAFLEPVPVGEVSIAVKPLRVGRHVSHVQAEVIAADRVCTRVQVVLAADRDSAVVVEPEPPSPGKSLAEGFEMPFIPGVTPEFTQHFEYHWTEGSFPYTGDASGVLGGFVRHRAPASGVAALIALLDAWPVPVLAALSAPAPASTIRWTATLFRPEPPAGFGWMRYRTLWAHGGYAATNGTFYDGDEAIAVIGQLVGVFDQPSN